MTHLSDDPPRQRIVYITLEYCQDDLFSGNGVCARSQVRGLSTLFSENLIQEVIVARPGNGSSRPLHPSDTPSPNVRIHIVPVTTWKTTDRTFEHERFAQGVNHVLSMLLNQDQREDSSTRTPRISAILAVDWTGMAGVSQIPSSLLSNIPIFFFNFRVYSRMTNISIEDRLFYLQAERQAVQLALDSGGAVMALSPSDGQALQELVSIPTTEKSSTHHHHHHHHRFRIILPMLRNEFRDIAKRDSVTILDATRHRPYFACIVRLSQDKGPQRFVKTCLEISQRDPTFWSRTRTIPVLAGAASQEDFADDVKRTLRAGVPEAMIVTEFMDAEALARLLQDTRLNLHPALYEAFGMTIVEAAACGVPTLLSKEKGAIGAEELISIDKGCAYGIDLEDQEALTSKVMELLQQTPQEGAAMAEQAYQAAMTWTELQHCRMLWGMISDHQKAETSDRLFNY